MNSFTRIPLMLSAEQSARLLELQATFAQVCNVLSPVVAQQRCWSRVTLHHLMYRKLRDQFPVLGSQMVCNAIFMVCKMGRLVYQSAESPFNVTQMGEKPLPTIHFAADSPVHFDSHTLSMKSGRLSIFTLGGRMRFALDLLPEQMVLFAHQRVLEITLRQRLDGVHELSFIFAPLALVPAAVQAVEAAQPLDADSPTADVNVSAYAAPSRWPDYLHVEEVR